MGSYARLASSSCRLPLRGSALSRSRPTRWVCPVVASDGVPASVVAEGENGRRYPFGDAGKLAAACIALLGDDAAWERCAGRARSMAQRYQRQPVGEAFENLCYEMAA